MRFCDNPRCTLQEPKELWGFFQVFGIPPDEVYRATLANDPEGKMRKPDLIGFFHGCQGYESARVIISAFAHFVFENADNYRTTKECVDHWLYLTAPESEGEGQGTEAARWYRGQVLEVQKVRLH